MNAQSASSTHPARGRGPAEPIAVVGAGCRFPGGIRDLDSFGRVLAEGADLLREVPADRWGREVADRGETSNHVGAFLDDVDRFDAAYFGVSPQEAELIDPQQRLLLEVAWEAMSDAGRPRESWRGSRTAVFVGMLADDYHLLHARALGTSIIGAHHVSGLESSFAAGRLSYTFDLHGPAVAVHSACSSSLLAVHQACQSLRSGEVDTALAGGTSLLLSPDISVFLSRVGAVSKTGRCRPFDAAADGLVRGEGCGVVVLKRLADALADGDRIHAVVRGTAAVHDGSSMGLTAPNAAAQAMMLESALADAGIGPDGVDFVEAHGTGTPLGDQVELGVLAEVLGRGRAADRPLLVGALKAVLGHTDAAAGIAGLLKAIWVVRSGQVPGQPGLETPNPSLDWPDSGLSVPTVTTALSGPGRPLRAGVSAFGLSGTNAHVIVEAPQQLPETPNAATPGGGETEKAGACHEDETEDDPQGPYLLLISTASRDTLCERLSSFWSAVDESERLADLTASAATRATFEAHRYAAVGASRLELLEGLLGDADEPAECAYAGVVADPDEPAEPVFVYSGQGGQWPGMAMDLYRADPVVRETFEECDALIRAEASWSLIDELSREPRDADGPGFADEAGRLERTDLVQPAIFTVQVALTRWLAARGVRPSAVIGHSLGEVAAAHAAGSLSLADGVRVIVRRARLLHETAGTGAMYAVQGEPDALRDLALGNAIPAGVGVAAVNGPGDLIIAGPSRAVAWAARELEGRGLRCRRLRVDVASHSPLVAERGPRLAEALAGLTPVAPRIRLLSSVTPDADLTFPDAEYWGRNLTEPVRLWSAIDRLLAEGDHPLVELGPHPVLGGALADALHHRRRSGPAAGTLRRDQPGKSALYRTLAQLYCAGAQVDWEKVTGRPQQYHTLPAPTWRGERYWLPGLERGAHPTGVGAQGNAAGGEAGAVSLPVQVRLSFLDASGNVTGEMTASSASGFQAAPAPAQVPVAAVAPSAATAATAAVPVNAAISAARASERGPVADGAIADRVEAAVRDVLGFTTDRPLMRRRGLFEQGVDSLTAARLRGRLESEFGVPLPATVVFERPSITALSIYLAGLGVRADRVATAAVAETVEGDGDPAAAAAAVAPDAAPDPAPLSTDAIAIVGISCRLPGADSPEEFWSLLSEGRSSVGEPPPGRRGDPIWAEAHTEIPVRSCYLDDVAGFDAPFFRISPREARSLDPQQRLMLEVSWDALEDAGLRPRTLGGKPVGVYVGLEAADYQQLMTRDMANVDLYYGTGTSFAAVSGRLSYFLGLTGPSIVVDTACSASLTAVHLACQGLRAGDCEVAVVGGANVMIAPTLLLAMADSGALAADGRCRTFDDAADGYGCGEGAVALVLKPLAAAERDQDRVYAVIRGSAVNQDGAGGGFTVPNATAQTALIRRALGNAGWAPGDVDYLEAHGTGTPLGDPIEVNALAEAYGPGRGADRPLLIGSVKPNVGHLAAAAGVTGLLKVVLSLQHKEIPRHLLDRPSTRIDWDRLPVAVSTQHVPWPDRGRPARAGVSSFGLTGTNAHVLVEAPPQDRTTGAGVRGVRAGSEPGDEYQSTSFAGTGHVVPVSAASPAALREAARRLARRLRATPGQIDDIVHTAVFRRSWLDHRLAVAGPDAGSVAQALEDVAAGHKPLSAWFGQVDAEALADYPASPLALSGAGSGGTAVLVERFITGPEPDEPATGSGGRRPVSLPGYPWEHRSYWFGKESEPTQNRVVFVYPGQGGQWPGMGADLLDSQPVFAQAMTQCDEALFPHTGWHVLDVIRQSPDALGLERVDVVQPALWAVMVSLTRLWQSLGVQPTAVVGHSQGEIAAAHIAGALSLADAAAVVALRSQAITALAGSGAMASLAAGPDQVGELIEGYPGVTIAAVNSPASVVVSGLPRTLRTLLEHAAGLDIRTRMLPVDYASHSPQVEQIRDRLVVDLDHISPVASAIPFYSAVTGTDLDTTQLNARYWYENLRQPVRFQAVAETLLATGHHVYLEPTPHPTLTPALQETAEAGGATITTLTTLRRDSRELSEFFHAAQVAVDEGNPVPWHVLSGAGVEPDPEVGAATSSTAATSGADIAFWTAVTDSDADALVATLGLDPQQHAALDALLPALAAWRRQTDLADWRYQITWKPVDLGSATERPDLSGRWIVAIPAGHAEDPWTATCSESLAQHGADVHRLVVRLDAADDSATDSLADELGTIPDVLGVVSLLGFDTSEVPDHPQLSVGLVGTTRLTQALLRTHPHARLWALTSGAVATTPDEQVTAPIQAEIHGLLRVVGLDTPDLCGGVIDVPQQPDSYAAAQVCAALADIANEDQLAVRAHGTLARRLTRAPHAGAPPRRWRPSGTVLVTGGTGALGSRLAFWLAAHGARNLLLLNNSGPDTAKAQELRQQLADAHPQTTVTIVACDLTDSDDLQEALHLIPTGHPLTAVFHTAGIVGRREPLDRLGLADFDEVFGAKVGGAATLDRLLKDAPLEAFVLFSSNAGVWGSSGQGPYAAANARLDALAAARRARGLAATSVAWGVWAGAGGSAAPGAAQFLSRRGVRPMPPELALAALAQVIDHDETFVSIADVEWSRFAETYAVARPRPLIADIPEARQAIQGSGSVFASAAGSPAVVAQRPVLAERIAGLPPKQRELALLEGVRAETARVLGHDGTGDVPPDRAFRDLGMDSVTGLELRNRLSAAVGLRLPAALVFNHPTPAAVASLLTSLLTPAADDTESAENSKVLDDDSAHPDSIDAMNLDELLRLAREGGTR